MQYVLFLLIGVGIWILQLNRFKIYIFCWFIIFSLIEINLTIKYLQVPSPQWLFY